MSTKLLYTLIILAVVWVGIVVAGVYVTMFKQPEELARVEKAEKVIRLKQAELASLESEHLTSVEQADAALNKWRSRYKVIPPKLTVSEVVGYLNKLTRTGFEVFDVTFSGTENTGNYSFHSFSISGRGYFSELYRIVREMENNRYFYRLPELTLVHMDLVTEDPETGREELKVMVSFQMQIDAIFGGAEGMSAPDGDDGGTSEPQGDLPVARAPSDMPPVPAEVLPEERPDVNPFFPLIMDRLPPNTEGLIEVERAQLVSIVAEQAIFQDEGEYRSVGVGDDVYLGQITAIDPIEGRVEARLNKGGIIDNVELVLQSGERYREALGTIRTAPTNQ